MKKKFINILGVLLVSISTLTGCTKCINKKTETVKATITNEYYKPEESHITFIAGKPQLYTDYAEYEITVSYDGVEYSLTDSDTYKKYHGRIGETVQATLITKTYDNGKVKKWIVSLGGVK